MDVVKVVQLSGRTVERVVLHSWCCSASWITTNAAPATPTSTSSASSLAPPPVALCTSQTPPPLRRQYWCGPSSASCAPVNVYADLLARRAFYLCMVLLLAFFPARLSVTAGFGGRTVHTRPLNLLMLSTISVVLFLLRLGNYICVVIAIFCALLGSIIGFLVRHFYPVNAGSLHQPLSSPVEARGFASMDQEDADDRGRVRGRSVKQKAS